MTKEKRILLRMSIITFTLSVITFSLYFNSDRCLKIYNAGFWLIFTGGMCFGVALPHIKRFFSKD